MVTTGSVSNTTSLNQAAYLPCPVGLGRKIGKIKLHVAKQVTERSLYVLIPPPGIEQKFNWWTPKKWLPRERLMNVIEHPPQRNGHAQVALSTSQSPMKYCSPTFSMTYGDYLTPKSSSHGGLHGGFGMPSTPVKVSGPKRHEEYARDKALTTSLPVSHDGDGHERNAQNQSYEPYLLSSSLVDVVGWED